MPIPLYQVDAFTRQAFEGNPAAVCLLSNPHSAVWMQSVAQEMNLSETAFLLKEGAGYRLRWFTPLKEVSLCGHATLASAHVLWEIGALAADETVHFYTQSGELTATLNKGWIEMNFPNRPLEAVSMPQLELALGVVTPTYMGKNNNTYVVEVETEAEVRALTPDFYRLKTLSEVRAVAVTSLSSTPGFDFISRFFAPSMGINEDPVTGSVHCSLVPYWAARLGRTSFTAFQASARGGVLRLRQSGERVYISGQAVTVMRGEFLE
jgi:PhzF family phenazine biosynthesis protein